MLHPGQRSPSRSRSVPRMAKTQLLRPPPMSSSPSPRARDARRASPSRGQSPPPSPHDDLPPIRTPPLGPSRLGSRPKWQPVGKKEQPKLTLRSVSRSVASRSAYDQRTASDRVERKRVDRGSGQPTRALAIAGSPASSSVQVANQSRAKAVASPHGRAAPDVAEDGRPPWRVRREGQVHARIDWRARWGRRGKAPAIAGHRQPWHPRRCRTMTISSYARASHLGITDASGGCT